MLPRLSQVILTISMKPHSYFARCITLVKNWQETKTFTFEKHKIVCKKSVNLMKNQCVPQKNCMCWKILRIRPEGKVRQLPCVVRLMGQLKQTSMNGKLKPSDINWCTPWHFGRLQGNMFPYLMVLNEERHSKIKALESQRHSKVKALVCYVPSVKY